MSAVRVELIVLEHAGAHMAGVEEISCGSVWHEDAHDTGVAPVVALRNFEDNHVGSERSE